MAQSPTGTVMGLSPCRRLPVSDGEGLRPGDVSQRSQIGARDRVLVGKCRSSQVGILVVLRAVGVGRDAS